MNSQILLWVLFINMIISVVVTYIWQYLVHEENRGVIAYIRLLSLLIPFFGLLFGVVSFMVLSRSKSENITDYEQYLDFKIEHFYEWRQQAEEAREIIPIDLSIQSHNPLLSQEFLIKHMNLLQQKQGLYLKKALNVKDTEVSHYASTTINLLKDRFLKKIKQTNNAYHPDSVRYYVTMSSVLEGYWKSDILEGLDRTKIIYDHLTLLTSFIAHHKQENPKFHILLAEVHLALNEFDNAEKKLIETAKLFPNDVHALELLFQQYVQQNLWKKAQVVINCIKRENLLKKTSIEFQIALQQLGDRT
ncbi:tetratricopeptide repeat protein [Bacillus sp. 2205SS5-2]|uniref:tetratricopeptide repeat protein n=1 Tax=Bacillus sp. 2205SS5-2 TaxID=3109031 RepID=UPI003007E09E